MSIIYLLLSIIILLSSPSYLDAGLSLPGPLPAFTLFSDCSTKTCFEGMVYRHEGDHKYLYTPIACEAGYNPNSGLTPPGEHCTSSSGYWNTYTQKFYNTANTNGYLSYSRTILGSRCGFAGQTAEWNGSSWVISSVGNITYFDTTIAFADVAAASYKVHFNPYCYNDDHYTVNNGYYGLSGSYHYDQLQVPDSLALFTGSPEASLSGYMASPSAQLVYLDIDGKFGTAAASLNCKISLMEDCYPDQNAWDPKANFHSNTSIATMYTNSSITTTQKQASGFYYIPFKAGSDREWQARGIEVPYHPGYTCSYPYSTYCLDNNHNVVAGTEKIASGSAVIGYVSASQGAVNHGTQPEPPNPLTNPLAWVVYQIRTLAYELFVPTKEFSYYDYNNYRNKLNTHAPFAYFNTLFNLNLTNPGGSETMSFDLAFMDGKGNETDVTYNLDSTVQQYIDMFKTGVTIILWGLFLTYLFFVPRRILS